MTWIKTSAGPLNLDRVARAVAQSDGSVDFYTSLIDGTPVSVAGIGTDAASAREALNRITQAVDPADY